MKGKNLKEHLRPIGLPTLGAKVIIIERSTKSLNDNVVVVSPEKKQHYCWFQHQEII